MWESKSDKTTEKRCLDSILYESERAKFWLQFVIFLTKNCRI